MGENAISGGGFADIWKGTIDGNPGVMALKVLRIFDCGGEDQAMLQVCHVSPSCGLACSLAFSHDPSHSAKKP